MKYQTLSLKDSSAFANLVTSDPLRANVTEAASFCAQYAGWSASPNSDSPREVELSALLELSQEINRRIRDAGGDKASDASREKLEGEISGSLHSAVKDVPVEILDDPRFWRHLSVRYFAEFITWREKDALKKGGISKYFSANESHESIPSRLYLRAQSALNADGSYHLAQAIPRGTDFWRSHILRVRTGRAAGLTKSFVELQRDDRLSTTPLRELAKLVSRMWANIMLFEYPAVEAKGLLADLRAQVEDDDER